MTTNRTIACEHGLIPLGKDDPTPCVLPWGHGGLHQTARGIRWVGDGEQDPDEASE